MRIKVIGMEAVDKLQGPRKMCKMLILPEFSQPIPEFSPWISVLFSSPILPGDLLCSPGFNYYLYANNMKSWIDLSPEL